MKKKGGAIIDNILIQEDIEINEVENLFTTIKEILKKGGENNMKLMKKFLTDLSKIKIPLPENKDEKKEKDNPSTVIWAKDNFYYDIVKIVKRFNADAINDDEKNGFNKEIKSEDESSSSIIFPKYKLWEKENLQTFITIDPTIIQMMIFDNQNIDASNTEDIVYSLKLIIKSNLILTLRYTTNLFPNNSKITNFSNLKDFNNFNLKLDNKYIIENYNNGTQSELNKFLVKYINLYNFYKRCYRFEESKIDNKDAIAELKSDKFLIDYQLKYISILGKARFKDPAIKIRCSLLTDYIMANLIFVSPTYAFISGGYKGFKDDAYGITRSGYEISKKYNRPIFTIMCNEGRTDAHQYSDVELIYGEHWGEDSIALSQFTDGAIIIAPFGGWTYIECLTLLANKKIIGIYNDFFNILNFDNKDEYKQQNINFFKFNIMEQESILMYYINYYLILLNIINEIIKTDEIETTKEKLDIIINLTKIIISFKYLKDIINEINKKINYNKISANINAIYTIYNITTIIDNINNLKQIINKFVDKNLDLINKFYNSKFIKCPDTYQDKIPKKCDGIWIKPIFNLIDCIEKIDTVKSLSKQISLSVLIPTALSSKKLSKQSSRHILTPVPSLPQSSSRKMSRQTTRHILTLQPQSKKSSIQKLEDYLNKFTINMDKLKDNIIFKNLNNNIIFVFSDIMYLNIYLNHNLNSINYQKQIHEKINSLMKYSNISSLIDEETNNSFKLSRRLDGYLNTKNGQLELKDIDKKDYSFTIDYTCYNYTPLLTCAKPVNVKNGGKKIKNK